MPFSHFIQKRVAAPFCLLAAILTIMLLVLSQPARAMNETISYSFSGPDGASPHSHLLRDPRTGSLYGITNSGGLGYGTIFKLSPPASPGGPWTETVLHKFDANDGEYPTCLIRDAMGNLYGTTMYGGSSGQGVVFELAYSFKTKTYSFEQLYNFTGKADGAQPVGLIRDKYGNLFGTAQEDGDGYGTLWEIDSTGFQVLYSFDSSASYPSSALAVDASGNLYVATTGGAYSEGAIFELEASGSTKLLYSFRGYTSNDGSDPSSLLVLGDFLYGTTASGGPYGGGFGGGELYRLSIKTGAYKVLHSFPAYASDGSAPNSLILANGSLFGTTSNGGFYDDPNCVKSGCGTVFQWMFKGSSETTLYEFAGQNGDGWTPQGSPVVDRDGNVYGTTWFGGANSDGSVFQLAP